MRQQNWNQIPSKDQSFNTVGQRRWRSVENNDHLLESSNPAATGTDDNSKNVCNCSFYDSITIQENIRCTTKTVETLLVIMGHIHKHFIFFITFEWPHKLKCLSLASLSSLVYKLIGPNRKSWKKFCYGCIYMYLHVVWA